jgi:UDP-N-acetylglucosamine--N-acetylmuramyl-(pentapeptide) pyrophosphoryl-undecaprenol N-acetylglucosamine transferase
MFTGGGSAGHVTVNLALIPCFLEEGWSVEYMGSENGMEKQLISSIANVRYHGIATGKLRRYFDWKNIKDPFKVVTGGTPSLSSDKKTETKRSVFQRRVCIRPGCAWSMA